MMYMWLDMEQPYSTQAYELSANLVSKPEIEMKIDKMLC